MTVLGVPASGGRPARIAFALYKYFPYGGVQRDALQMAQRCVDRGHEVEFFAIRWDAERPRDIPVNLTQDRGVSNHSRYAAFAAQFHRRLREQRFDIAVGFNKMPGLQVYFAADGCFVNRARERTPLYRLTPRYRHFAAFERAVFAPEGDTDILVLVRREMERYQAVYGTPEARFHLLPPGVIPDRAAPDNRAEVRAGLRAEFGIGGTELLVLMVGSGFRTKGLDRALRAVASLPPALQAVTRLIVIGRDHALPYQILARRLGIRRQVEFFDGRDDIPRFLQGADLLIHPAYYENSGMVLLESLVAGLPVLTTDACGYAPYIKEAAAGRVLPQSFRQETLNRWLAEMLADPGQRHAWSEAGIAFGRSRDLFSLHDRAADVIDAAAQRRLAAADAGEAR